MHGPINILLTDYRRTEWSYTTQIVTFIDLYCIEFQKAHYTFTVRIITDLHHTLFTVYIIPIYITRSNHL